MNEIIATSTSSRSTACKPVSLMWAAPGTQRAKGHPAILDEDRSADALRAIGNAFQV
jgi:hypothetical protein